MRPISSPWLAALSAIAVSAFWVPAAGRDCNRNGIDDALDIAPSRLGLILTMALPTPGFGHRGLLADFNGDARSDVVETQFGVPKIQVLLNDGRGAFPVK